MKPDLAQTPVGTAIRGLKIAAYLAQGRRPWSRGYYAFRNKYLEESLGRPELMARFRDGEQLPDGYGQRLDARMVELPWVVSRMPAGRAAVLDAGSSLNHRVVLDAQAIAEKDLTIVTLAPEAECFWNRGISYVFGDLRRLVFRDAAFDVVACISTIEHVGMDNALYTGDERDRANRETFETAIAELRRVLKPGGTFIVSMPFGRYENHGWFQQFDSATLDRLIVAFGPATLTERIYRYRPEGWQLSDRDACRDASFFDIHHESKGGRVNWPGDMPAGERAVACLEFRTSP